MPDTPLFSTPRWLKEILADPFKKYLILLLSCLAFALLFFGRPAEQKIPTLPAQGVVIDFFFNPQCPHCHRQKAFNAYLRSRYPEVTIVEHDTSSENELRLLIKTMQERGYKKKQISVPATFIGPYSIFGFHSAETTGVTIEKALTAHLQNDPSIFGQPDSQWDGEQTVMLPLFGELRVADYSLPVLAIIIGLVDGFNPCAMWVLVYLISLIVTINGRRKIWLLVGTFVFASGALYFLFMTA
jgi:glutaredoxin